MDGIDNSGGDKCGDNNEMKMVVIDADNDDIGGDNDH